MIKSIAMELNNNNIIKIDRWITLLAFARVNFNVLIPVDNLLRCTEEVIMHAMYYDVNVRYEVGYSNSKQNA